jgi:hypothetical protein
LFLHKKKYLKTEAKCVNDYQINEEIKRLQAIRLENQNESEEIRELFGSKQHTQSTTQRKATYESSDEEVATKKNSCCGDSSDEGNLNLDEDVSTGKSTSRGRGARGAKAGRGAGRGRGRGRGRGAAQTESRTQQQEKSTFMSSSNSSKLKKEPDFYSDDEEIIEIDNEKYKSSSKLTSKTTSTRSQALETKSQNIKTSTTPSVRRTRIDYDDDENDDDLEELVKSSNKKAKPNTAEFDTQSQSSNTFSIFKKVANKKKF